MYSHWRHPRCRWVCFFIRTDFEKLALHQLLTSGSSAVNWCRQNESPNSWYKHHNNPQVIHKISVHQFMSCRVKKPCVCKNWIHNWGIFLWILHFTFTFMHLADAFFQSDYIFESVCLSDLYLYLWEFIIIIFSFNLWTVIYPIIYGKS